MSKIKLNILLIGLGYHARRIYFPILQELQNKKRINQILVKKLNLSFGRGTRLLQKDGVFTGHIRGKVLYSQEKAVIVKNFALQNDWDLKESYAFTDSHSDLPLLKIVGHPVTINPDQRLKRKAQLSHWSIYNWKVE